MKTLKNLFIIAIAATGMAACNNELNEQTLNNDLVKFSMGIGSTPSSRISMGDDLYEAKFSEGDEVGIFVQEIGSYTNVLYSTADGSSWTSTNPIKLKEGTTYTYYAYSPYSAEVNAANNIATTVATDQNTEGYIKNDFLISSLNASESQTDVKLDFSHALSLVDVTLKGNGVFDDATVNIIDVATSATIDLTTSTVNTEEGEKSDVTMDALNTSLRYRAIIPAQEIAAETPIFKISTKGRTYQAKYSNAMKFEQGKYLAMVITIGEEGDEPEIEITTSANINDWTEGTNDGNVTIGVSQFNIPMPEDGKFTLINKNWSNSASENQIPQTFEEIWYERLNVVDSMSVSVEYDSEEAAIKFTNKRYTGKKKTDPEQDSIIYSKGAWNNNCVVFHSTTPLDTTYYKLSFKAKSTVDNGIVGVAISNSSDNRVFPLYDANGKYWNRTVTTIGKFGTDWTENFVIFGTTKVSDTGKSSGIVASSLSKSSMEDVNKGVNIILYASKDLSINSQYIKDIKIEKYEGKISY